MFDPAAIFGCVPKDDCWGLTFPGVDDTLPGMAKTDVVEFTHHASRNSTSIAEVWWNANTFRLTVRFLNGGLYSYDDVGKGLYESFVRADSMGQFFRETFRHSEWPGAKHNERLTKFVSVPIEGVLDNESDLDAMKVTRLTSSAEGGNKKFTVHYTPAPGGREVEVRAASMEEAVQIVKDYFLGKKVAVSIDGVFIDLK